LIYFNQGNYEETIKYYEKCIKIQEEAKDKKAVIPA
jgi:tetratricopeptide (TPR) repeat protein